MCHNPHQMYEYVAIEVEVEMRVEITMMKKVENAIGHAREC